MDYPFQSVAGCEIIEQEATIDLHEIERGKSYLDSIQEVQFHVIFQDATSIHIQDINNSVKNLYSLGIEVFRSSPSDTLDFLEQPTCGRMEQVDGFGLVQNIDAGIIYTEILNL